MASWWNRQRGALAGGKGPKRIGTDGSDQYTKNKKVAFYYYHSNSRRVLTFKPFLTSLSYKMQYAEGEEILKNADGYLKKDSLKRGITYSIGLSLPAHSVNEAILNLSKMNELKAFHFSNYAPSDLVLGKTDSRDPIDEYMLNTKMIFMSNIISNGNYVNATNISSHKKILKYGLPGIIKDLKIEFDKSLGFFEDGGKLYPKLINLSFDLDVLQEQVYKLINKRLLLPFEKSGAYKKDDVKYWPFGITGFSSSDKVSDGDGKRKHANLKNLWFSLASEEIAGTYVIFPLMAESISLTVKNEFDESTGISKPSLFNRKFKTTVANKLDGSVSINTAAATVNEARNFMYQIQKLFRLINFHSDDYKITTVKAATSMTPNQAKKAYADPKYKKHLVKKGQKIVQWTDLTAAEKTTWKNKVNAEMTTNSYSKGEWKDSGGEMKTNYLHVTNLIGKNKINGRPNKSEIISKGHLVKIKSFSFEPDLSLGFFDEDNFLYFKSMKISFDFEFVNDNGLLSKTYGHIKNSEKEMIIKRNKDSVIDISSVKTYDKII